MAEEHERFLRRSAARRRVQTPLTGKAGTKRHLLIEGDGVPLSVHLSAANRHNLKGLTALIGEEELLSSGRKEPSEEDRNTCAWTNPATRRRPTNFSVSLATRGMSNGKASPMKTLSRAWRAGSSGSALEGGALQPDLSEAPKKLTVWARQMICQLRRWLSSRALVVVGDSSFAAKELLAAASGLRAMVTRLRLDAALCRPAPPRKAGQPGRPRVQGAPAEARRADDLRLELELTCKGGATPACYTA